MKVLMQADDPKFRTLDFVIVCAGGDQGDLSALLRSVGAERADLPADWRLRIVVVENTEPPHDGALAAVCSSAADVSLRRPARNIGYGAGINFGVRAIGESVRGNDGDWIIVCNADLVFPPGSLRRLLCSLDANGDERLGLVAPRLLDPSDRDGSARAIQPSVGRFPNLCSIVLGKFKPRRMRKYISTPRSPTAIDWATGACLAVRSSAFAEIEGFDEAFFLDYEDVDLCRRLANAGWQRMIEPGWEVIHRHPLAQRKAMPAERLIQTRASLVRYLAKHGARWEFHVMGFLLRLAMAFRRRRHPMQAAWRSGYATYRELKS